MKTIINQLLKMGTTPYSWKEETISLIPHERKDKLDCGSYQPLSVLNQDYKIFTHILPKRL